MLRTKPAGGSDTRRVQRAFLALLLLSGMAAPAWAQPVENEVVVFAAASMAPVLNPLAEQYRQATGIALVISYASSAALAQQIQRGAPAALFISADPQWAAKLRETKHVAERVDFLGNSLVLVVPAKAGNAVTRVDDLRSGAVKRIAIGDPASVPAGKYAREALETLGMWDRVQSKLVPGMDVRQALLYVERGEVEAGIVYATDAKGSPAVRAVAVLDDYLKTPVMYSLVLTAAGKDSRAAQDVFAFLLRDTTMTIFESAGFTRTAGPANPDAPNE